MPRVAGKCGTNLNRETPNVIFLNMRSPVTHGIKLAASVKAHPAYKNIPILAASRDSPALSRERCQELGFDDFIAKPLVLPELEMRLTNILSVERQKTIRATDPANLESKRRQRKSRRAGPSVKSLVIHVRAAFQKKLQNVFVFVSERGVA